MEIEEIREIKKRHTNDLANLKNVISIGVGFKETMGFITEQLAIIVGVWRKLPPNLLDAKDIVPLQLEGVVTDVVQVGRIEVLPPRQKTLRGERVRPVIPGYSCGNEKITAGTLGCAIHRDNGDGTVSVVFLSNAHVFVDDPTKTAPGSTRILQPGSYDGGLPETDEVASLLKYIQIHPFTSESECPVSTGIAKGLTFLSQVLLRRQSFFFAGAGQQVANLVDAAIANPLAPFESQVEGLTVPTGMVEAMLGMKVEKSGRTTEVTRGTITQIDVTTSVGYGNMKLAVFDDQVIINGDDDMPFSAGGDSGSVIFKKNSSNLCGLLFAGNSEENVTVANRIQHVATLLNLDL